MKVWAVRLSLSNDGRGNWLKSFRVETDGKDYQLVDGIYYQITKSWYKDEIPSTIYVKSIASGYLAECGFDSEPTEMELERLKQSMLRELKQFIEDEFERQTNLFRAKMSGLISEN